MGPRRTSAAAPCAYWSRRCAALHAPLVPHALKETLVLQEIAPPNGQVPTAYVPPAHPVLPAGRSLRSLEKTMDVTLDGDYAGVSVRYHTNPSVLVFEDFRALGEEAKTYHLLVQVLRDWNITDDDGQKLPLTEDSFRLIPSPLLQALYDRFWELVGVGKTTSDSSSITSRDTPSESPSGTPSTSSPANSA